MADNDEAVQGLPAADLNGNGQPATTGAAGEATATPPSTPQVTPEFVQAAIADALRGFGQQSQRTLQSQLDKRDGNIRKQIAALQAQAGVVSERAKARGIEAAQAEQIGQDFFNANLTPLLAEEDANGSGARKRRPAPADGGEYDGDDNNQSAQDYQRTVSDFGTRLAVSYGLVQGDPEIQLVVHNQDPETYLASIERAGKAKQQRLAEEQQRAARPAPTAARSPALGVDGGSAPRNPIANVTDVGELYRMGAKQK